MTTTETTTKHTPGPWKRNIRAGGAYPTIFAGRNTHIASARGHGELSPGEIEANIDLLAAAPELLAALIDAEEATGELLSIVEGGDEGAHEQAVERLALLQRELRAAIAKAEGRAP